MANFEQCIFAGHLGKDAEMRYTPAGDPVTTFSLAVTKRWQENGEWRSRTKWIRVACWRDLAERWASLTKGQNVMVIGTLQGDNNGNPRTWKDQSGETRASFEMTAERVLLLEKREQQGETGTQPGGDEDIPF